MFENKSADLRYDASELKGMDLSALFDLFHEDSWTRLDAESRRACLQEVENRYAAACGRPPIPVYMDCDPDDTDSLGGYTHALRRIDLNQHFFTGDGLDNTFNGMSALETIIHEGRHAFQSHLKDHRPEGDAMLVLKEWLSSDRVYFCPMDDMSYQELLIHTLIYPVQSIEMDARRFARTELEAIRIDREARGLPTDELDRHLGGLMLRELTVIKSLRNVASDALLDTIESNILNVMRVLPDYSDLDLSNFHPLDTARFLFHASRDASDEQLEDLVTMVDLLETLKLDGLIDVGLMELLPDFRINQVTEINRRLNALRDQRALNQLWDQKIDVIQLFRNAG